MIINVLIAMGAILLIGGITVLAIYLSKKSKEVSDTVFDYILNSGIRVKLSPNLKIDKQIMNAWADDLIEFWNAAKNWNITKMLEETKTIDVYMYDELYITIALGRKVNAITFPGQNKILIAVLPKEGSGQTSLEKTNSLFRHEVSHIIVGKMAPEIPYMEYEHHKLFAEVKLGA